MKRKRNDNEIKEPRVAGAKQDVPQQINGWKITADKDRDGGEGKLTASYTQIGAMLHEQRVLSVFLSLFIGKLTGSAHPQRRSAKLQLLCTDLPSGLGLSLYNRRMNTSKATFLLFTPNRIKA